MAATTPSEDFDEELEQLRLLQVVRRLERGLDESGAVPGAPPVEAATPSAHRAPKGPAQEGSLSTRPDPNNRPQRAIVPAVGAPPPKAKPPQPSRVTKPQLGVMWLLKKALEMCARREPDGMLFAFPGIETLSRMLGISTASTERYIGALRRAKGTITVRQGRRTKGMRRQTNEYTWRPATARPFWYVKRLAPLRSLLVSELVDPLGPVPRAVLVSLVLGSGWRTLEDVAKETGFCLRAVKSGASDAIRVGVLRRARRRFGASEGRRASQWGSTSYAVLVNGEWLEATPPAEPGAPVMEDQAVHGDATGGARCTGDGGSSRAGKFGPSTSLEPASGLESRGARCTGEGEPGAQVMETQVHRCGRIRPSGSSHQDQAVVPREVRGAAPPPVVMIESRRSRSLRALACLVRSLEVEDQIDTKGIERILAVATRVHPKGTPLGVALACIADAHNLQVMMAEFENDEYRATTDKVIGHVQKSQKHGADNWPVWREIGRLIEAGDEVAFELLDMLAASNVPNRCAGNRFAITIIGLWLVGQRAACSDLRDHAMQNAECYSVDLKLYPLEPFTKARKRGAR